MVHIPDGSGFHGGRPVPGELGEQGHQHARDDAVRQIFGTGGTCQIQYAVLKENDYKYPTTLEEYEAMIKSYLEAHPTTEDGLETIGITMSASDWHWMITLGNPAGFIADAQPDNGQWLIDENYNCTYKHASDDEKEYFKWPSRMYDEGILDPNFATQTDDDYIAKLASGRVVAITDANWHYAQAHAALKAENKLDKTYCDLPVTMDADDKAPTLKDWGEGSHTFRCVRTGKYMNTRLYQKPGSGEAVEPPGRIRAEKDNTLNWFVMEIFHVEEREDENVILTNRFGSPVQVCEDGGLWSMKPGEGTPFRMEVVKDGQAAAAELAKGKDAVVLALGCNSIINAKEEVDRGTIELPPAQRRLMEAVYEANSNVALVLFSNYPYAIGWAQEKLPAIVWSATGAQDMGAAMAETLFGANNPAGRLNMTWYQKDEQLPDIHLCGRVPTPGQGHPGGEGRQGRGNPDRAHRGRAAVLFPDSEGAGRQMTGEALPQSV